MKHYCDFDTLLGHFRAVAEDDRLVGLHVVGQKHAPMPGLDWRLSDDLPVFQAVKTQLREFFAGERLRFDLRLDMRGTDFQKRVWQLLNAIPVGETRSYSEIAHQLGDGAHARAVATAVARNPHLVITPCHRVIGADGSLVGYAAGVERKRLLLSMESNFAHLRQRDCA